MRQALRWRSGQALRLGSEDVPLVEVMVPPAGRWVFESLRAYHGRIFRCGQHLARLRESCQSLQIPIPWSDEELTQALERALRQAQLTESFLRLVVYAGGRETKRIASAHPAPRFPRGWLERGINVVTAVVRRSAVHAVDPKIKAGPGFLSGILAHLECGNKRIGERIFVNAQGHVTEGTTSNVFLVKHGRLVTPPTASGVLAGVTREVVIELADGLGLACEDIPCTRHDLFTAAEAFVTSTSKEIMPIWQVDGRVIGDGRHPITQRLSQVFQQLVREECHDSHSTRAHQRLR